MLISLDSLQALKINKIDKSNSGSPDIIIKRSGDITFTARDSIINVTKVKTKNVEIEEIPQIKKFLQYRSDEVSKILKKVPTSKDKEVKRLVDYLDFDSDANLCVSKINSKEHDIEEDSYSTEQIEDEDKQFITNFNMKNVISLNIKRLKLFVTALDEMIKDNPETGSIKIGIDPLTQTMQVKAKIKNTRQEIFATMQGSKVMNKKSLVERKYFSSREKGINKIIDIHSSVIDNKIIDIHSSVIDNKIIDNKIGVTMKNNGCLLEDLSKSMINNNNNNALSDIIKML